MEQKKVEAPIPTPKPEPTPPKKEINLFASDSNAKSAFDEPEEDVFSKPVGLVKSATETTKPAAATFQPPVKKQATQKESDFPPIGGGLPSIGGGASLGSVGSRFGRFEYDQAAMKRAQ